MGIVQAVVLGIVQGLGEFLPISSSGHLVALPWLVGWGSHSLQFDIALHLGTLIPLLAYFWRDWVEMALAVVGHGPGTHQERVQRRRLAGTLIIACIPAAVFGVLLEEKAETLFRSPLLVAGTLATFGLLMLLADRASSGRRTLQQTRPLDGLVIGLAQALALVPGVSRSGSTITAGLLRSLTREDAARFSFLLSMPIVLGAVLLGARKLIAGLPPDQVVAPAVLAAGVTTAMLVGFAAIPFLLAYLRKHDVRVFVYYRWALAAVIVALWTVRG